MAKLNINIPAEAGILVGAVYEYLIAEVRKSAIKETLEYQHNNDTPEKQKEMYDFSFFSAYLGSSVPGFSMSGYAIRPEEIVFRSRPEKVVGIEKLSQSIGDGDARIEKIWGIVIMRSDETSGCHPNGVVTRYRASVNYRYSKTGNLCKRLYTVTRIGAEESKAMEEQEFIEATQS